eukprot:gb/GECG01014380.1/.p1 GENE.gb/GECG01014380.1/~~gb/GECG01014380.1/.p1  ORF type:complete len:200 (+),score=29.06 gb/GECG01014380.1/:1-600(+)
MFSGPVKHVFFTGPPGIGKSTLVSRVASTLKERLGCDSVKGFVTEEVRRGGTRQGFDVVTTDSKRFPLSRAFAEGEETTGPKVGKYTVFLEDFNCAVDEIFPEEETRATQTVFALDEVGKMELFSDKFKDKVSTFLETSREVHVIGTPHSAFAMFVFHSTVMPFAASRNRAHGERRQANSFCGINLRQRRCCSRRSNQG